jgi:hypothetical protein
MGLTGGPNTLTPREGSAVVRPISLHTITLASMPSPSPPNSSDTS